MPYLEPDTFVYNAAVQSPEIKNFNDNIMEISEESVTSACNVDKYNIVIILGKRITADGEHYYVNNYEWANGSIDNIVLTWNITPKSVKYPNISKNIFVYDGEYHSPESNGFIPEAMKTIGTASAVNVDEYKIGFILEDKRNYIWEEGTVEGTEYSWEITPAELSKKFDIPAQNPVLIYNGTYQVPTWDNYDQNKLSIGGIISGINAGEYLAQLTPTKNYVWNDGTTSPIEVPWIIEKLGINDPFQKNVIFYSGEQQAPEWNVNYSLADVIFEGETTGINAGEYGVIRICDSNCYFLSTGTDSCSIIWKINKKPIPAPYVEEKYYYTGDIITPIFHNYDRKILDISGNVNGIEIGDYIVCFEIKDKSNYIWAEDVIIDSVVTKLSKGTAVKLTGKTVTNGGYTWAEVIYNGKTCWCDKQWINY